MREEIWAAAIVEETMRHCILSSDDLREAFKLGAQIAVKVAWQNLPTQREASKR